MRILCVCDEGNNRSVHIAHLLRYRGHDTLPVGVRTANPDTVAMLASWADRIIVTDPAHLDHFAAKTVPVDVWPIPDVYPRPFNPEQHRIVRGLIADSGL